MGARWQLFGFVLVTFGELSRYHRSDDKRGAHLLNGLFRKGTVNTVHVLRQLIVVVNPRKGKSTAILLSHFVRTVCTFYFYRHDVQHNIYFPPSLVLQQVLPLNPPPFPPPLLHFSGAIMPSSMALRTEDNNSPSTLTLPFLFPVHLAKVCA